MHILGILVAVVGGIVFWYWRFNRSAEVIDDAVNAYGSVKGAYKRRKFRKQAESATLGSIDDPALAVAVLLVGLVEAKTRMTSDNEAAISKMLEDVVRSNDPEEQIAFARWACREVPDINEVIRRLLPLWNTALNDSEKRELLDMAKSATTLSGEADDAQLTALKRLRGGLNFSDPRA